MRHLLLILMFFFFFYSLKSQTCCSGGVPIASNLGFSSAESGILQLSLNYDFNKLTNLFTDSEKLDDDLRKRITNSYLIRANYSISSRFAIEGFFSLVNQSRTIYGNQGEQFKESSFGIGDPALLLIYKVFDGSFKFRIGGGPQIPLGASDKRNSRGLLMVEDLQPGSGAWDLILFSSIEYSFSHRPSLGFYANFIQSLTGTNNASRGGSFTYQFGNDLQIISGIGDQVLIYNKIVTPGIALRFRIADVDRVNGNINPGTGGSWLFLKLSSGLAITPRSSINISYEIPMYTQVNDTQLSPTYILNIAFGHSLNLKKDNINSLIN